jgi:hypothetical protein
MNLKELLDSMDEEEKLELYSELKQNFRTDLKKWTYNQPYISIRLLNILTAIYNEKSAIYLEDVTKTHFDVRRNAGLKTWMEFIELRGY